MPKNLRDTAGHVIMAAGDFLVHLDAQGEFAIELPATDSPDVLPFNWAYDVRIEAAPLQDKFRLNVPYSENVLEFSDMPPVTRGDEQTYAFRNHVHPNMFSISGGTLTGPLTLAGAPTTDLHAATKGYVDSGLTLKLNRSGGTLSGPLTLSGAPTVDLHAATKKYADDGLALKLNLTGGTMTAASGTLGQSSLGRNTLKLGSSFAGGENTFDSTGRLDLESYQRAQLTNAAGTAYAHYGEVIRIFSRKHNSKQMIAWYGPTEYDGSGDPATDDTAWFWMGAHYNPNNPAGVRHGHWSIETPDATAQLQTRMEFLIWDPETGEFGMNKTKIITHDADFVVEQSQGALHLAASAAAINLYFNRDSHGANAGKRWAWQTDTTAESGSNVGSDLRLVRFTDAGAAVDVPIFIKRSNGVVGIGSVVAPAARLDVLEAGARHTVRAEQSTASAVNSATYGAVLGNTANRAIDVRGAADSSARLVIYGTGRIEIGDGGVGGRDTVLYRDGANILKTDDHYVISAVAGAGATAAYPLGPTAAAARNGLQLLSSFAGGEDNVSGTDTTSRINLYSYQRAAYHSFGETIRKYLMRQDSKAMLAWYGPQVTGTQNHGYDGNRDALTSGVSWKPWSWLGAHYEANDHGSVHGHISIEVPDTSGALQTRFEILFADRDTGAIGLDKTFIITNQADLVVRCSNGQVLRMAGAAGTEKAIEFNNDSFGATASRRWKVRANSTAESGGSAGTDFQIVRYNDSGAAVDAPIEVTRSSGKVTVGGSTSNGGTLIQRASTSSGLAALTVSVTGTGGTGVEVQQLQDADRAFQTLVSGDANRRLVVLNNGLHEWGDGANARDTNLYRNAADQLKTDDSFVVGARLTVGTALNAAQFYAQSDGSIAAGTFATSADGTAALGTVLINPFSTSKRALDIRLATDSVSRLRVDVSAGSGSGTLTFGNGSAADTNLYRSAADTLKTDDSFHVGGDLRHLGTSLGFYNGAPVAKPTITGPAGGNAAVQSIAAALAALGLVVNNTTA
ncbi:hypothetical protein [Catellatospora vulcania]|uniref:hypothetical protein n=1 Tax=Catellatospora vulcania TaxID=1460450 RepID=UPI0012D42B4B|nr:hypothetical protein [Catellatospora vulcania]